ncbi:hypothetical protein ZWY2020_010813 [Hordeum vulgare]|nr:hypothetical protein ZWY2020_010813 [Hordeum vulgare]
MERVLIFLSTDQGISTGSMRSMIPEENSAMAEEDRRNRRGLVRREAEEDLLQELVRQRRFARLLDVIRCGSCSFHLQKSTCSSCGYPAARIQKCKSIPPPDPAVTLRICESTSGIRMYFTSASGSSPLLYTHTSRLSPV